MSEPIKDHEIAEEYCKLIIETLSEGVSLNDLVFDENGNAIDFRIIATNKAYYHSADYNRSLEPLGALGTQLYGMDIKTIREMYYTQKDATETIKVEYESPINKRHFIVSFSPIINNKFVTSFFDITDRRQAEIALKEQKELMDFAFESAGDGVWDWDIKTNRIKHSKKISEMFWEKDVPSEISLDDGLSKVFSEDVGVVPSLLANQFTVENLPFYFEHRSRLPNGEFRWFLQRGGVVQRDSEGKPLRMIGTSLDITRIKIAETQIIQNSKMSTLGEMSAGIAHEINNPLTVILFSLDLLNNDIDNPEKVLKRVEDIGKAVSKIDKIVKGLKKFSHKSESIQFSLNSVNQIVQETILLCGATLRKHGVLLTIDAPQECYIQCDEIQIEQVLINLITNSVDAIKNLQERWITLKIFVQEKNVVLHIIDSGPKIAENLQNKLFEPFFTTKPIGEGTGLGLPIIKTILEKHHATIRVDNSLDSMNFIIKFLKAEQPHETH